MGRYRGPCTDSGRYDPLHGLPSAFSLENETNGGRSAEPKPDNYHGWWGNICIITSDSLVVVVDSKMDEASEMLYQRVTDLAVGRKIVVINTQWHPDHVGGNKLYTDATIIAGGNYSLDEWGKKQVRKAFLRFGWRTC
jgi:glyoxylase-like metal-dependent hydrolase (beta-lactamase superfamily II)